MNPRKSSVNELSKIQLPGIQISELLDLEEILPELTRNLIKTSYAVALIAQIKDNIPSKITPSEVFKMESVNTYIRKFLSQSEFSVHIAAAVAIRKTMAKYGEDLDIQPIVSDHRDLSENLSGKSSTRGGLISALSSPERLRSYRRGIMLKTIGKLQSTPIYYPLKISRDINRIGPDEFISCLPFKVDSNIDIKEIVGEMRPLINVDSFSDLYKPCNAILLEEPFSITRELLETPPVPDINEEDIKKLPAWRKAAISQRKQINNKTQNN